MKRIVFLITITFILLTGCASSSGDEMKGEVDIRGFVLDKTEESILVVSSETKDFSATGGIKDYYDAINLTGAPGEVQIGDEVMVWYSGGVQESYPMGGAVGHLEIMPDTKPEGARLTQSEALKKALEDQQNVIVTSITFNQEAGLWLVEFKDLHEANTWKVEVDDSET